MIANFEEECPVSEDELQLIGAQEDGDRYLRRIFEAISADSPDEARRQVQEALNFGDSMMDSLEEALTISEDPEGADLIEDAMQNLGLSMDLGEQIMDAGDEELDDLLSEMRRYAEQAADRVSQLPMVSV